MTRPHLILVPGLICDADAWQSQVESLSNLCHIQIAVHGHANSLLKMAEQVLALAPARFALAGHSMGARVALEVLALAPERVTHLALLSTGYEGVRQGDQGLADQQARQRLLDIARSQGMQAMVDFSPVGMVHESLKTNRRLMARLEAMVNRSDLPQLEAQIQALLNRPDRTELLKAITIPTLVLCGREDPWATLEQHRILAGLIPGSQLVAVPECGHMCTLEQPDIVSAALEAWLFGPSSAKKIKPVI